MRKRLVKRNGKLILLVLIALILVGIVTVYAQTADGNQGIIDATTKVKSYFKNGTDLLYAIGAVTGLVGAVKVYNKWSGGEPDTAKVASSWLGACIFLVVVATILKSFFGV